jgi:hypothetical protein
VGGSFLLFFFLVPNVFSSCSLEVPQVPNLFPKEFPIAPQFYPIWFAQSSTLMYINWKGRLLREYICIYFATGGLNRLVKSLSLWLFVISSFLWLCLLLLPFFLILFVYTRYVHPWKQLLGKKAKICLLLQLEWCLQDKEVMG